MTQREEVIHDLTELETPLRLTQAAIKNQYFSAALSYLEDIEAEAIRLKALVFAMREELREEIANAPIIHPNDPAFVPHE